MSEAAGGRTGLSTLVESALVESFSKIFKVNINTGQFEVYKNDGLLDDDVLNEFSDIYEYMQKLITDEIIYPEYATTCRRFTNPEYMRKSLFSGEKRLVQSYRRRTAMGDRWITLAIIAVPDCGPDNPVALFTWREADSDAITLLDTLPTISSLYDKLIRINLSNNTYAPVIVGDDDQDRLVGGIINMYEWWAAYSKDGNIAAEDMSAFSTLTRTGSLQKRFAEDPTPVNFRYRRKVGDEFRWMQLQIAPSVEYSEENQIMLLSLKDVHDEYTAQMRSRQELIDSMNRDALTKLFNRLKFNADIDSLAKRDDLTLTCLYIDVNGLHELNNLLGHQKGDDMLCRVAETLVRYFPDERVYRIGGDEFVVTSLKLSKADVGRIVSLVRSDLQEDHYEISVGIETGACGRDVEKLVAAAELAMRNDKAAYYMRHGDRRRKREMNEELEQILVEKRDKERFLDIVTKQFTGVYFVDLASDTARYIYNANSFSGILGETGNCFSKALELYLERCVEPEDRCLFDDLLDYDTLERKLNGNEIVELNYRKTNGADMMIRILKADNQQKKTKPETIWMIWRKPDR